MANIVHNQRNSRTYTIWRGMKARCTNPKVDSFPQYGGRGIKVCPEWSNSFAAFFHDMGAAPAGMTIDRVDNAGDYEPGNCRWATQREQQRNRTTNLVLEFAGRRMCAIAWAEERGFNKHLIVDRVRRGWSTERAITTPPRDSRRAA